MMPEEIIKMIDGVKNLKHRTILMLLYSSGMRLNEIANLRIVDIDSKNMRIKIVQGKGGKDRFTILSQQVLLELRAYYIIYRPKNTCLTVTSPAKGTVFAAYNTLCKKHY